MSAVADWLNRVQEARNGAGVAMDWHTRSVQAGREQIEAAIDSGKALIAAKALVPHGQWLPWLEANFQGSERNARNYMALDSDPDLSIREAVKALGQAEEC